MSSEDPVSAPARRAADLQTNDAEQQTAFFEDSSHVAPIGNVVAGLVALSLLWSHVPRGPLWTWFAVVVVLAALQALAAFRPETAAESFGARGRLLDTNVLAGVIWGVLPWLDIGAFRSDEVYRWICLALAFGIGAGAMGGLSVLTGIALRIQIPMYLLVAGAFLVGGNPEVALGVLVYLALMTSDLRATGRHLRQLVATRIETADLAADAETEARHDPLTGLLNRAGAFERIEELRGGDPFVMMFVDLDHFKEVNDRLGHEAGDHVLVETARRLERSMRPGDIVARLGGDEFLVVFSKGGADLEAVTSRMLSAVERPIAFGDDEAVISASIGVTVVNEDGWSTAEILREADHALYEAKRMGRDQVVWFDERLAGELEQRMTLEGELRAAVATGAVDVRAQPVVAMADGRITSVEFTPWWTPRAGAEIQPERLRSLVEEIGLSDALTRSILDRAARARVRWRGHTALGSTTVTVRIMASHLIRGDLVEDVGAIVASQGLRPGELQLMLTETAAIRDPQVAAEAIGSVRSMGVGIVLGEFGAGKSSLRDLLGLPIDLVAVHSSLVRGAANDERVATLLAALDHVAGELGLSLAADGVDTPDQLETVRRVGLPYAQGDALCPPRSILEIESGPESSSTVLAAASPTAHEG